jgi:hypothetical protein
MMGRRLWPSSRSITAVAGRCAPRLNTARLVAIEALVSVVGSRSHSQVDPMVSARRRTSQRHRACPLRARSTAFITRFVAAVIDLESSCSQTRITVQPSRRYDRVTRKSRRRLFSIFRRQNSTFDLGMRPWRGHPCQKHESTKTTTFADRKTTSGVPRIRTFLR